jgi:membrane associated rhomboid family serine protease
VGFVVAIGFGSVLLSGLEPHAGISWQGHLFGGIGGVLAARLLSEGRSEPRGRRGPTA